MKGRILLPVLIFLISVHYTSAQKDNVSIGGKSSAMAGTSVTLTDFWSVHNNQAGMAYYDRIAAGIYYENRFLTKEMGLKCFSLVVPVRKAGVFGLNYSNFGYSLYHESKVGLAYAMAFGDKISGGVQLDYIYTHIGEGYGNKSLITFEAGIRANIYKGLVIAAHVFNPANLKISKNTAERIPLIFKIGASYDFAGKALLAAEVEKDLNFKPVFKTGLEYHVSKPIYLRVGIATNPMLYSFGAGFEFSRFRLDIAASYHMVLGFSPQASLVYDIFKIK